MSVLIDCESLFCALLFRCVKHQEKLYLRLVNDDGFQFLAIITYFDMEKKYYLNVEASIRDNKWLYKFDKFSSKINLYEYFIQFMNIHKLEFKEVYTNV